jgi:hypothetical protein
MPECVWGILENFGPSYLLGVSVAKYLGKQKGSLERKKKTPIPGSTHLDCDVLIELVHALGEPGRKWLLL